MSLLHSQHWCSHRRPSKCCIGGRAYTQKTTFDTQRQTNSQHQVVCVRANLPCAQCGPSGLILGVGHDAQPCSRNRHQNAHIHPPFTIRLASRETLRRVQVVPFRKILCQLLHALPCHLWFSWRAGQQHSTCHRPMHFALHHAVQSASPVATRHVRPKRPVVRPQSLKVSVGFRRTTQQHKLVAMSKGRDHLHGPKSNTAQGHQQSPTSSRAHIEKEASMLTSPGSKARR